MKILHINSNFMYTKLHNELINSLSSKDVENKVYSAVVKNHKNFKNIEITEDIIVNEVFTELDRVLFHLKQKKIYNDLYNTYNFNKIDIIHSHTLFTDGYAAYQINKKYGLPYVVSVRNTDINTFFKKLIHLRKVGINILKNASNIVFLSKPYYEILLTKYIPDSFKNEFIKKSVFIPNGVNDFWHDNINRPKKHSLDLNLLFVGRINKNKNILTGLKAAQNLLVDYPNLTFNIVGEIEDTKYFDKLINYSFVKYQEPVNREELINIYRKNDIFVMPSYHESFGLVYVEAMSQGLPIIYTKNQGFDRIFNIGEIGYSVNPNDVKDITHRLYQIIDNYITISRNTINSLENFKWDQIAKNYKNIYLDIVSDHEYGKKNN